jgi:hypothetical protein
MALLIAAVLIYLTDFVAAAGVCIDVACTMSLTTSVSDGNLTFTGTCATPGAPIAWCAFGLSQSSGALPMMIPAEAFVLQPDASGVVVRKVLLCL